MGAFVCSFSPPEQALGYPAYLGIRVDADAGDMVGLLG